jgi:hypothetical protein
VALPWTVGKTADLLVGIIGEAKQGNTSEEYAEPSHPENDPQQHQAMRFNPVLRGWS